VHLSQTGSDLRRKFEHVACTRAKEMLIIRQISAAAQPILNLSGHRWQKR